MTDSAPHIPRPILRGTVALPADIDFGLLPEHLAECLRAIQARDVEVAGASVTFRSGEWIDVPRWHILKGFGRGVLAIDLDARRLEYCLSCRWMIVSVTAALAVLLGILTWIRFWPAFAVVPMFWIYIVGGNLLIGGSRFREFAERVIANAPRRGQPSLRPEDIEKGLRREHFL